MPARCWDSSFTFLVISLDRLSFGFLKRGDAGEIDARESLNFQLSMLIYEAVALVLCFVLIGIPILLCSGY